MRAAFQWSLDRHKGCEEHSPAIVLGAASAIGAIHLRLSARLKAGLGAEITNARSRWHW